LIKGYDLFSKVGVGVMFVWWVFEVVMGWEMMVGSWG